jgi:hypothetical protein
MAMSCVRLPGAGLTQVALAAVLDLERKHPLLPPQAVPFVVS